jgi:hypothetical protein
MSEWLDAKDAGLVEFGDTFSTVAADDLAAAGLTAIQLANFNLKKDLFIQKLAEHNLARLNAKSKTEAKEFSKADFVSECRTLKGMIEANPAVLDSTRLALGLPVSDGEPSPAPVPTATAVPSLKSTTPGSQTIQWKNSETGKSAKPAGARGTQVFLAVIAHGAALPESVEAMQLVDVVSASKLTWAFSPEQLCKTAVWRTRYVTASGEVGPLSAPLTATIVA